MAGMSDYLEAAVLNEVFRNTNLVPPATYVALFTADPTDTGSTTNEITGNGYARQLVNKDGATAPYWNAPVDNGSGGKKCDNQSVVTFPVASAAWGTITHMAVFDALTGGNCLFTGALTASKVVGTNDQLTFPANSLTFNLD